MHRKVVREQYEPYSKWSKDQEEKQRNRKAEKSTDGRSDRPEFNDTINAAGKEWSKQNTLSELRDLNTYLWDNFDERIPVPEYKKLVSWIKEKENLRNPDRAAKDSDSATQEPEKEKTYFEYQGRKYSKNSPYEKLTGLSRELSQPDAERLPINDYQKLRGWIENADRARWSGIAERQLEISKRQFEREAAARHSPNAGRYVPPLQQQMMSNPVVGLFMQGASVANELVRWIDLRDHRDPVAEARDGLEDAKKRKIQEHVQEDRTHEQKTRDQETIENIDKALDENKEIRKRRRKDKERDREKRDRGLDFMR